MVDKEDDCEIPSALVPKCPACGGNMDPHIRINQYFVQKEEWHALNHSYNQFLKIHYSTPYHGNHLHL